MEIFEQVAAFNRNYAESLNEFNIVLNKMVEKTTSHAFNSTNKSIALVAKQFNDISKVKKPEELLSAQTDFLTEAGKNFVNSSQEMMSLFMENFNELNKWFEKTTHNSNFKNTSKAKA